MNKHLKPLLFIVFTANTYAATSFNNLILVSEGTENGYEDYRIFVDPTSVKKVEGQKRLFNIVSTGLSLDETVDYEEPKVTDNPEEQENQDSSQLVILSEIDCKTKTLKPVMFTTTDLNTGKVIQRKPTKADVSETFDAEDQILKNIHKEVCKKSQAI